MLIFITFNLLEDEGFFIVIFHYPNEDSPEILKFVNESKADVTVVVSLYVFSVLKGNLKSS